MTANAKYIRRLPGTTSPRSLLRARRAILARLFDKRLEERRIPGSLRMPLDADDEPVRRILDAFERPVRCPGRLDETVADAAEGLVVVRGHVRGRADDLTESGSLLHLDRVDGELPGDLLVVVVPGLLGEMLDEVSPTRDVQELEPATDRKHGHVPRESRVQQRHLAGVPPSLRRVRLGMRLRSVVHRVEVGATREHDRVERVERLLDAVLRGRDHERAPTRLLDRVDVVQRDERGRKSPDAPARLLRVRGDPDDRSHAASDSTIQSVPSPHVLAGPSNGSALTRSTRTVAPSSSVSAPRGSIDSGWKRPARTCRSISVTERPQSIHAYSGSNAPR